MFCRKVLFSCLLLFAVLACRAQNACEEALTQATQEFNAGHLYGIPAMLGDCLEKNQNREWRQRAFLLLAETYLLLEDNFGAENSYLEVLRANPEFVASEQRDPIDLVYLSSKFTATPIFTLYAKAGGNTSVIRTILDRSLSQGDVNPDQRNVLRPGFQIGGGVDWNYNENISASVEGEFIFSSFKQRVTGLFRRDVLELIDRQSWVRVPLYVKYAAAKGTYRPYAYAGLSFDFLVSDRVSLTYLDPNPAPENPSETANLDGESPVLKFTPKRNLLNRSFFVGGGVKYKIGLNYVFADLRYSFGMTNLVDEKNSIYDYRSIGDRTTGAFQGSGEAAIRWAHIDDLFRMDNVFLNVGYIHPLYKPRKLKRARSKSILRTIKKQGNNETTVE